MYILREYEIIKLKDDNFFEHYDLRNHRFLFIFWFDYNIKNEYMNYVTNKVHNLKHSRCSQRKYKIYLNIYLF